MSSQSQTLPTSGTRRRFQHAIKTLEPEAIIVQRTEQDAVYNGPANGWRSRTLFHAQSKIALRTMLYKDSTVYLQAGELFSPIAVVTARFLT